MKAYLLLLTSLPFISLVQNMNPPTVCSKDERMCPATMNPKTGEEVTPEYCMPMTDDNVYCDRGIDREICPIFSKISLQGLQRECLGYRSYYKKLHMKVVSFPDCPQ